MTPYTITLAEYRRAMRMNLFRRRRNVVVPITVVVLASLLILWITGWLSIESALTVMILGPALMAVAVPAKLHLLAKRLYAQQVELQRPIEVSWDAEGLRMSTEHSSSLTPWGDYLLLLQDDRLVLLYLNDMLFQMVPKRAFESEDELAGFLATAAAIGT